MDKKTFESSDNSKTNANENLSTKEVSSQDIKTEASEAEVKDASKTNEMDYSIDYDHRDDSNHEVHTLDRKNKYSDLETAILVKDLDLYYGDFQALKGVNMDIKKGQVTAFIGPSGCGKSTTLK